MVVAQLGAASRGDVGRIWAGAEAEMWSKSMLDED